jgi:hypothetical protein
MIIGRIRGTLFNSQTKLNFLLFFRLESAMHFDHQLTTGTAAATVTRSGNGRQSCVMVRLTLSAIRLPHNLPLPSLGPPSGFESDRTCQVTVTPVVRVFAQAGGGFGLGPDRDSAELTCQPARLSGLGLVDRRSAF